MVEKQAPSDGAPHERGASASRAVPTGGPAHGMSAFILLVLRELDDELRGAHAHFGV